MRFALMIALSLCLASPAVAALSGYWQSSKVLHAILENPELADALRQQPIVSVAATDSGYRIRSRDCTVDVEVVYEWAKRPGLRQFTVKIGRGACI